jgi:hypothetical protein
MPPPHDVAAALGRRALGAFRSSSLSLSTSSSSSSLRSKPSGVVVSSNAANPNASSNRFITIRANAVDILTHHRHNTNNTQRTTAQCCAFSSSSSTPPSSSLSTAPTDSVTTNLTVGDSESTNKSIFSKLWDKYSFEGQRKRIILGERLFRSAQYRANDP